MSESKLRGALCEMVKAYRRYVTPPYPKDGEKAMARAERVLSETRKAKRARQP